MQKAGEKKYVLVSFPIAVIKYAERTNIKEKQFIWSIIPCHNLPLKKIQGSRKLKPLMSSIVKT